MCGKEGTGRAGEKGTVSQIARIAFCNHGSIASIAMWPSQSVNLVLLLWTIRTKQHDLPPWIAQDTAEAESECFEKFAVTCTFAADLHLV